MELQTKHLAPYLAFNLMCQWEVGENEFLFDELKSLSNQEENKNENYYEGLKPVLRPLSQLTKTITHGGKTFVPLGELAKKCFDPKLEWKTKVSHIYTANDGPEFGYNEDGFWGTCQSSPDNEHVGSQLELFQLLFEWHFDVFGLIGDGLAIVK